MISAVINYEDNRVSIHTSKAKKVDNVFEKGFYEAKTDNEGNLNIIKKSLFEIHDPFNTKENSYIVKTMKAFFSKGIKEKVNDLGFIHKLGILLYGRQGTGKTSVLNYVANSIMEHKKAIVFFCNDTNSLNTAMKLASMIREIQENPVVFIADEFERYVDDLESEMKNFLDGKDSIENSLFLAATNYIEQVPNTLKERPSRFRVVLEIPGITDKAFMKDVLNNISSRINPNLMTDEEINKEVKALKDCTLDDLKHIALNKVTNSFIKSSTTELGFYKGQKEEDYLIEENYTKEYKSKEVGIEFNWVTPEESKKKTPKESNIESNIGFNNDQV